MIEVDKPSRARESFFWHIVEESLDEAEFLWTRWEGRLDSHELSLEEVDFWTERRLRGALDGVLVARDAALERLLEPALASDSPGRVAAAAYVLASLGSPRALSLLTRAVESFAGPSLDAVIRGAQRSDGERALAALSPLLRTGSPQAQAAVLELHVGRGLDAGATALAQLLGSRDPRVLAAALRAARFCPGLPTEQLLFALDATEPEVLVAAIETGLWRGSAEAWEVCLRVLQPSAAVVAHGPLLPLLAASGAARAHAQLIRLLDCESLQRDAAFALGCAGSVEAAEACLSLMHAGRAVRVAGEAFCFVTGLSLAAASLIAPEPASEEAVSAEDDEDLDAELLPSLDDLLPLPDVAGVAAWWQQHKKGLVVGARYVRGRLCDVRALHDALVTAPMRRRHELARELALRSTGAHYVATRAMTRDQTRQLAHAAQLERRSLRRIADWAPLP